VTDLATLVAGFERALAERAVLAGTRRAHALADVLRAMPPANRSELYWRARVAMLPSVDDLDGFEAAFAQFFGARGEPRSPGPFALAGPETAPLRPATPQRADLAPEPSAEPAGERDADDAPIRWLTASQQERLVERSFDAFTDDERALMLQLLAGARIATEFRRSRRRRSDARGNRFDLRATLRAAARTAGELLPPRRTQPRKRRRPLVFLLDVSGSMEPFARALIGYAAVVTAARPAVRTFTFATRLRELTPLLRRASPARVLADVLAAVPDFGGGTRIGASLHAFNERYAQRGAARGGTVVILSDGWERDEPERVAREMARLQRLSRRIIWINPQKRHAAYEPLVRGMAAALPYVDALLSGHNLRSLDAVAAAIAAVTPRRRPPAPPSTTKSG
jgi:uncharacterized protein with von Willebrand factor type A (vWA) domain